ncbi:MAG: tripartite tricarboxylate transporter permease, partial [Mailhella sp.]|nr:tripartite tricarboxylate transporter permease [Mailhella sp.]
FGDISTTLLLIMVAGPVAGIALKLGPSEMGALVIFALTIIAALESASLCKGILAAALGMLLSSVGLDPVGGNPRLTLGIYQLEGGIRLIVLAIGTMAMAELYIQSEKRPDAECGQAAVMVSFSDKPEDRDLSFREFISHWKTLLRSTGIGAGIGALPGIGAAVAGFLAYGTAKNASDDPDSYGNGNIDGVAAPESSNSAVVSASLIPLLTLGIPGSVAAAMLIGAFMLQGVTPGPLMYENQPEMIYGIYGTLVAGNLLLLFIGYFTMKYMTKVLCIPTVILMPCIMFVCMLGSYMETGTVFPVVSMGGLAIFGYFLKKLRFSFVCVIVGFILGPLLELYVQQVVIGADGDYLSVVTRPGTAAILVFNVVFLVWISLRNRRRSRQKAGA